MNPLIQAIEQANYGINHPVQQLFADLRNYQPAKPPPPITLAVNSAYIKGLLTRDFISSQTRQWPLLNDKEMGELIPSVTPWWTGECGHFNHNGNFYVLPRLRKLLHQNIPDLDSTATWKTIERQAIEMLDTHYALVTGLLQEFDGRIIAAGGAITKALLTGDKASDIDLFFIDPHVDRDDASDAEKRAKYDGWLAAAIAYLTDGWLSKLPSPDNHYEVPLLHRKVYVFRNEFVTTVYLSSEESHTKYQFIHRVYPNIGAVLGGFDLGPAMVAYTGTKIVATELGAWSA
ncbi:MAG: hypothetical protein H0X02_05945, partial [Nitrosomonas sp.]|nr:hypothetical protein [Nitrosomonas sp.]